MDLRWITAFIDQPGPVFDAGTGFWRAVTASGISAPRGGGGELATLLPPDGDPYLRVQRIDHGRPGIHLDLHVPAIADAVADAKRLGATTLADPGHVVLRSPGGIVFCVVEHRGEARRPAPVHLGSPNTVDQVSLDVPPVAFDGEVRFWHDLTGWEIAPARLPEFVVLERPAGMPLRLLVQRLGEEDRDGARAHLDVACGDHVAEVAAEHRRLGAAEVSPYRYWTTMRDPAGLLYCLTRRDPSSGHLGR